MVPLRAEKNPCAARSRSQWASPHQATAYDELRSSPVLSRILKTSLERENTGLQQRDTVVNGYSEYLKVFLIDDHEHFAGGLSFGQVSGVRIGRRYSSLQSFNTRHKVMIHWVGQKRTEATFWLNMTLVVQEKETKVKLNEPLVSVFRKCTSWVQSDRLELLKMNALWAVWQMLRLEQVEYCWSLLSYCGWFRLSSSSSFAAICFCTRSLSSFKVSNSSSTNIFSSFIASTSSFMLEIFLLSSSTSRCFTAMRRCMVIQAMVFTNKCITKIQT